MIELFILTLFTFLVGIFYYIRQERVKVPVIKTQEEKIELPIDHENFSEDMMKAYIDYKHSKEEQKSSDDL